MTPGENYFWELAAPLTRNPHVSRSTMMGLPCLRWDGRFFASVDRRTGELIIKLAEARVNELVAAGQAGPFAPAGRRFRQWVAVDPARRGRWSVLLEEAVTFVSSQ